MVNVIKLLRSITAGSRPSGRVYGEPYVNLSDNQFGVFDSSNVARDLLGVPIFSAATSYSANQVVNYQGQLYIARGAVAVGAWNLAQWRSLATNVVRSHLAGLTLSAAGSSPNFGIAIGAAADNTNVDMLSLTSALTKGNSGWTAGNSGGAGDTGTMPSNTWCHVYLIKRLDTGVVDVCVSTNASAPTFGANIPSAYTLYRRIGSMRTDGGGNWTAFKQKGDEFLWSTAIMDYNNATITTSGALYALSVPFGIQVNVLANIWAGNSASNGSGFLVLSPDQNQASGNNLSQIYLPTAGQLLGTTVNIRTNTSSQVFFIGLTNNVVVFFGTLGWIDRRGRDN